MSDDRYDGICSRIREHCRQQGWYGPDADKPRNRYTRSYRWGPPEANQLLYSMTRGCNYTHAYDANEGIHAFTVDHATDPRYLDFECSPATEDQLSATERALGFALPPLLRALYAGVANGGFGPDYGITGAAGGWSMDEDDHYATIDHIDLFPAKTRGDRYVKLAKYDPDERATFELVLPHDEYPAHLLPICYGGCGIDTCLDLKTGRIYANLGGVRDDMGRWCLYVVREAMTLGDWIEAWLRDNSHHRAVLRSGQRSGDSELLF